MISRSSGIADYRPKPIRPKPIRRYYKILHLVRFDKPLMPRVRLFDYRKAFDLTDHNLLARKIKVLDMPRWVRVWVLDFLSDRKRRVKLSSDCQSEWGLVPAGMPQGTKIGPWLLLLMINDLVVDALTWKYVDDTTIAQTIPQGLTSDVQSTVSAVEAWFLGWN